VGGRKATRGGERDEGRKGCVMPPGTSRSRNSWKSMAHRRSRLSRRIKKRIFMSGRIMRGGVTMSASFYDKYTYDGVWAQEDLQLQYEEMIKVRDLGADTPTGVPYIKEQILAMARKSKQRGHIPKRGRQSEIGSGSGTGGGSGRGADDHKGGDEYVDRDDEEGH
nr:hypothetical protein [Tanacetum cinerariifolium]